MANPFRDPFINSLKHRLLVHLWRRAEQDGSAMAKRRFFQYFDQLRQLRMWKMQLLDENHLFIKYTSEDVVTLRVTDPSQVWGSSPALPCCSAWIVQHFSACCQTLRNTHLMYMWICAVLGLKLKISSFSLAACLDLGR
jgi:hypothetical protein